MYNIDFNNELIISEISINIRLAKFMYSDIIYMFYRTIIQDSIYMDVFSFCDFIKSINIAALKITYQTNDL